jgi:acyl dehydratase
MPNRTSCITIERSLSQHDFDRFAQLSGDGNPIHVDPAYAAGTRFGRTVAHGVLLVSILRGLAEQLVPGARQTSQTLVFPAPSFADDPLRFSVQVTGHTGDRVALRVASTRVSDGTTTCHGEFVLQCDPGAECG